MKPISDAHSSATEESDFYLITAAGCAEIDQGQAERALEILYDRYANLLMGIAVENKLQDLGADPDELIQQTFLAVWEHSGDFDPEKRHEDTPVEDAVKFWIVKIFKNKFRDALRAIGRRPEVIVTTPEDLDAHPCDAGITQVESGIDSGSVTVSSERVKLVQNWLDTLAPGDRDLLLISVQHIDCRRRTCVIPPELLRGLATVLGVLPESIKVKRARLMQRLKTFLQNQSTT
jgi:RNA polymerase sigma factor (sigma-70 family)